jgi:hypothetical protein
VFAGGHFWVNNSSPSEYVEIDAGSGRILRSINPPARDPNVLEEGGSITPFAVEGDVIWVTSAHDLVKIDTGLGSEIDRFKLDALREGAGLAEGVAVGAGSV